MTESKNQQAGEIDFSCVNSLYGSDIAEREELDGVSFVRLSNYSKLLAEHVSILREVVLICSESNSACRKRMGTRVGNVLVAAEAALAKAGA